MKSTKFVIIIVTFFIQNLEPVWSLKGQNRNALKGIKKSWNNSSSLTNIVAKTDEDPIKSVKLTDLNDCIRNCANTDVISFPPSAESQLKPSTSKEESQLHNACILFEKKKMCRKDCPASLLRDVADAIDDGELDMACEMDRNWKSYKEYSDALNCTEETQMDISCDNKCGPFAHIASITRHKLRINPNDVTVEYFGDVEKNTATVRDACKAMVCRLHCYKPFILDRCGRKAYNMHLRLVKQETTSSLSVLRFVSAINLDMKECNLFR